MSIDRDLVLYFRKEYPKDTRVQLLENLEDTRPILKGEKGTAMHVDDCATIHVKWDNGRMLGLIPETDFFTKIKNE
jgi:hypothetical protein